MSATKPAKETITERELGDIKRDRAKLKDIESSAYEAGIELNKMPAAVKLAALNKEASELRASLAAREESVIERLRRKVKVVGKFLALLEVVKPPCRPSWKDAFTALAVRMKLDPKAEEKRVKDATIAAAEKQYTLVVE